MPGSPSSVTAARRLGCLPQLLGDRVELGAAPDDRAGRPPQLDRERALGPDEGVERTTVGCPHGRPGPTASEWPACRIMSRDRPAETDDDRDSRRSRASRRGQEPVGVRLQDRATLASGSIRAGVHASPQRTANAAASRSRSSMRTQAASRCGSR